MSVRIILLGIALVSSLLLAGCQTTSPEPSVVESEKCYSALDKTAGTPDLGTSVDCGQPHSVEVQGAVDLPGDLRPGKKTELTEGDKKDEFATWSQDACENLWADAIGTRKIAEAAGLDPQKDAVVPAFNGSLGYALTSDEEWDKNIKKVMCFTSFTDTAGKKSVDVTGEAATQFFTPSFPLNLRQCVGENVAQPAVDCSAPHYIETIFSFDPKAALGTDFVKNVNPDKPTAEQYQAISDICGKAAKEVYGAERKDLRLVGDFDRSTWNPDNSGSYAVFCSSYLAQGADGLLNNTVVGLKDAPLPKVQ